MRYDKDYIENKTKQIAVEIDLAHRRYKAEHKGINVVDLMAANCCVSKPTIYAWLNGEREIPSTRLNILKIMFKDYL